MSDYQISVHHPDFPDDTEFEIEGVGVVKNGGTATVTTEMQDRFKADRGFDLKDALEENPIVGVGKAKPNTQTGKRTPNEQRSDEMMQAHGTESPVPVGVDAESVEASQVEEGGES